MNRRVFLIVLDSLGIGALPDAHFYGDEGSNTLAAVEASGKLHVPNLARMGLFNIDGVCCGEKAALPSAAYARLAEKSAGKDTTVGHWEIAGLISPKPLPTYPDGFPQSLMETLARVFDMPVLCGKPYSGTKILLDYGREHIKTAALIVYTSADSVLQIAAHEETVPISALYDICAKARKIMSGDHGVGRIIARPFIGEYPNYKRTANRRDFSLPPPGITLLDILKESRHDVIGVGKIHDIFAGRGLTSSFPTKSNHDGMTKTIALAKRDFNGLCFVNLVDFDTLYGHRNDADGYARALSEFDIQLGELTALLKAGDILIITADHGCDPSTPSTDHSREYVPMLIYGGKTRAGKNLGTRESFADIAATVQSYFGIDILTAGKSFLKNEAALC
ncbi:MAG: phosphopentomutase [Oscillospiraceae bacterium]|nr:phosphopentomutase [Oscillospiraceae bacterium]